MFLGYAQFHVNSNVGGYSFECESIHGLSCAAQLN